MEKKTTIITLMILFTFAAMLAASDISVLAANNETTYARVYVINTPPNLSDFDVNVTPQLAVPSDIMTVVANITDDNNDLDTVWAIYYNTTGDQVNGIVYLVYNATSGLYENNTFQLPADADAGTWTVTVFANDTYVTVNGSDTFTVQAILNMQLHNTPIDFGNTTAGVTDRRADNSTSGNGYTGVTIKGFPLLVNNTGNLLNNYTIEGLDLLGQTDGGYNIGVGNVTYNLTNSGGAGALLSTVATQFNGESAPGATETLYFWVDVPLNVPQQEYRGNVTVRAIQS